MNTDTRRATDMAAIRATHRRQNAIIKSALAANPKVLARLTAAALRAMGECAEEQGRPNPIKPEWLANLDAIT